MSQPKVLHMRMHRWIGGNDLIQTEMKATWKDLTDIQISKRNIRHGNYINNKGFSWLSFNNYNSVKIFESGNLNQYLFLIFPFNIYIANKYWSLLENATTAITN